jgi:phage-related minor tail protein
MRSSDIFLSIFVLLIFAFLYYYNILAVGMKEIEDNWPEYRCNPAVMPFAGSFGHDAGDNFTYCIQNMQTDYMGVLLQPVNYTMSLIGDISGDLTDAVNNIRAFINNLRNFVTSIVQSIFGVFLNILIEFQKIIIKTRDMIGKVIGIIVTMMYLVQGSLNTMNSAWAGPMGALVRSIGGGL